MSSQADSHGIENEDSSSGTAGATMELCRADLRLQSQQHQTPSPSDAFYSINAIVLDMEAPRGWLLTYCLTGFAVSIALGYMAVRDQIVVTAIESVGFFVVAALLWMRSRWALYANAFLGLFILANGIYVFSRNGQFGLAIAGICVLGSYWTFRDEIADAPHSQRRKMGYGMGMSFDELLAQENDFDLVNGVFCLIDQAHSGNFDASQYREVELPIMLVWHANGIIGNGGFEFLFEGPWNGDPDYSRTVAAHAQVGHNEGHQAFLSALSAFPGGVPPLNESKKHARYMELPDIQRTEINRMYWGDRDDRTVEQRLATYIRANADRLGHLRGRIS